MIVNFYSIATVVALLILFVASWKAQKWVGMTATALLVGVGAVFQLQGEYFDFSFYLFQILLLLLGTAFFVQGRSQKLLIGLATTVVVTAGLIRNSLQLDHL